MTQFLSIWQIRYRTWMAQTCPLGVRDCDLNCTIGGCFLECNADNCKQNCYVLSTDCRSTIPTTGVTCTIGCVTSCNAGNCTLGCHRVGFDMKCPQSVNNCDQICTKKICNSTCEQGRSQDFSKGGSHWVIQRVLTRLSPEYCGLSAYKKAYKGGGGVTGTPGPPWLRPCL